MKISKKKRNREKTTRERGRRKKSSTRGKNIETPERRRTGAGKAKRIKTAASTP